MSSIEIINNLKAQLRVYEEMLGNPPSTSSAPLISTSSAHLISKPKTRYLKAEDIMKLFNLNKSEYNNILVNIKQYIKFFILSTE